MVSAKRDLPNGMTRGFGPRGFEVAQRMARHSNPETIGLYDRGSDDGSVGEVEWIGN